MAEVLGCADDMYDHPKAPGLQASDCVVEGYTVTLIVFKNSKGKQYLIRNIGGYASQKEMEATGKFVFAKTWAVFSPAIGADVKKVAERLRPAGS
jgi:hypothetical protein